MKYITVYQEFLNVITYVENDNPDRMNVVSYDEFIEYLSKFPLRNWPEFLKEFNSFKIIEINLETGEWEILDFEKSFTEYTFEDLYEINSSDKKEKKDKVQSARDFVDYKVKMIRGKKEK